MNEIADAIVDLGAPEQEGFRIIDLGGAAWAMRKLARIRAQQREIEQTAQAEIERIQQWSVTEQARLEAEAEFFAGHLRGYHRDLLERDPKAKTVRLPHGQLRCRAQRPEYLRDDEQLLAWAEATDPALVTISRSPRWEAIRERGQVAGTSLIDPVTGEAIPGVTVVEREPKFRVDVEVE